MSHYGCYTMLHHVMQCYTMLNYVIPCYTVLHYVTLFHTVSNYVELCYANLHGYTSYSSCTSYTSWAALGRQLAYMQMSPLFSIELWIAHREVCVNELWFVHALWIVCANCGLCAHCELCANCELCARTLNCVQTVNCVLSVSLNRRFIKWRSSCPLECVGFVSFKYVVAFIQIQITTHRNWKSFKIFDQHVLQLLLDISNSFSVFTELGKYFDLNIL